MDRPEDNEIVVNGQVQEVQWDGCAGAIPDVRNPVSPSGRGLRLQEALNTHRFPNGRDGIYGPFTEALVKKFQESKGLIPDGVAGPATMAALGL